MSEAVPAWLAAWRAGHRQPQAEPASAPPPVKRAGRAAVPPRQKANYQGFVEPERWAYDGGVRREPVLDTDYHPPRVVRKVGWRTCIACGKPFFSEDVVRLRLCDLPVGCRDPIPRRFEKTAAPKETGRLA